MNSDRNPKILWEVFSEIVKENTELSCDLKLKLVGKVAPSVLKSIKDYNFEECVEIIDYLPHNAAINQRKKSQILLLLVNNVPNAKGIVTGKIFEYLIAKRPVIAIAPIKGDLSTIIKETNSGVVIDFEDKEKLKETILNYYTEYKNGGVKIESDNIEKYHRKKLTEDLSLVIKSIV